MNPSMSQSDFLSAAPPKAEPRAHRLPTFQRLQLAGGLKVLLAENHVVPLVQLHAAVHAGAQFDPAGMEGTASLLASALKEGTVRRGAERINEAAEDLGADILTRADWELSSVVIELMSSDLPFAVETLFEMLASPALPRKALEGLRRRHLSRLDEQSAEPREAANDLFARAVYGDARYGLPLPGTPSGLQRIDRETLLDFHHTHFGRRGMVVVAAGSFRPEELLRLIEAAASSGLRGEPPSPRAVEPPPLGQTRVWLRDAPRAAQTELRLGHVGVPRGHPEFASLQVMSAVLGRRLKRRLREELGYTYHLRCRFVSRHCAGPFAIAAGVGNEHVGTAVREVVCEMERLQQEPVSGAELDTAQNYLTGVYLRSFQPGHDLIAQLKLLAAQDLPDDHFARYLQSLCEADAAHVTRLARRYLHPRQMAVAAVGPAASLRRQLAGCGELVELEPDRTLRK
ncbi:MAG: insulinase family protein [Acidobacteria bacterium]|nr:insulinase family protein [Acidobacteriota bacterium]